MVSRSPLSFTKLALKKPGQSKGTLLTPAPPSSPNASFSKYIVGADGSSSTVRTLAGIQSGGEPSPFNWIRIDGVMKTDMPDARIGFAAIESATHGNVLWAALDHGATRVGLTLPPDKFAKYNGKTTEDDTKNEAIEAMLPFKLEILVTDWWTCYRYAMLFMAPRTCQREI
jgi:2-polyprenyl-6-methoxyphenol hydroxylase-like FAD-dependent oxidoreductase